MAAGACGMCGASTPFDARFCPQCGSRLDIEVVDLTQPVSTDHTPESATSPRASRLLVGLGAALVLALAGLWLLSGDDQADEDEAAGEQAEDEDEPTSGLDDSEVSPVAEQSLESVLSIRPSFAEVEEVLSPGEAASIGLVSHGDAVFWFTGEHAASDVPATERQVRSPLIRRSDDGGSTWTEVAHDLPSEAAFGPLAAVGGQLALAGVDGSGKLTIWRSDSGATWTAEALADDTAPLGQRSVPTSLQSSPAGLIMLVTHAPDLALLEPILPTDRSHLRAVIGGLAGDRVDFVGPMGIRIEGPPLEDPGLTAEMRAAIEEISDARLGSRSGAIWIDGEDGWRSSVLEGVPTDLTVLPDGSPLVIGITGTGTREWTLEGNGQWQDRFVSPDLVRVTTWRGQTIATGSGDLRIRSASGAWEPYGLFNALPRTLQDGFLVSAAGDTDILAVSLISTRGGSAVTPPGPSLLAKDGFVLTYDISRGTLTVTTPSDTRIDMAPWQPSLPAGVSIDTATPALVVEDPDSDAATAFTFSELAQLERAATTLSSLFEEAEVLVSVDGRTWARGDVPENSFATQLLPLGDSVLTVVGRFGAPFAGLSTDGVRLLRVSYS